MGVTVLVTASCEKPPEADREAELFLHWFAAGREQELISLWSDRIRLGERIESEGLEGVVIRDSRGLHATLEGSYGMSVGEFGNYIEEDEVFSPALYSFSGAIHVTYFVVSTHPDPAPFFQRRNEMNLRGEQGEDPYAIDLDLPLFVDPEPGRE